MLIDKSVKRQVGIAAAAGFLIICILAVAKYRSISKAIAEGASHKPPPDAVATVVLKQTEWDESINLVGSLAPVRGTMISAEEPGKVVKVNFESGTMVQQGDLLIEIDTSVEEANLKSAVANAVLAKQNLDRAKQLISVKAASKADLDTADATFRAREAEAASIRAVIAKKRIVAPFSGRVGIRSVNLGQYVSIGDMIVPIQDLTKLYVDFTVPQSQIGSVSLGNLIEVIDPTNPDQKFSGVVSALNPQVEEKTRNLSVQGIIENPSEILRPGMYVRVRISLPQKRTVIAVPTSAVSYAPYGDSVYVVERPDGEAAPTVRQQIVKLGVKKDEAVELATGVKEGEEVVVTGVFKLRPGASININNAVGSGEATPKELPDT